MHISSQSKLKKDIFVFSLTQSGRSSLRSSTEEDYTDSSKNTSLATPRYTVLMLGGSDSGKTTLTSQFMSSNNVGGYINETIGNIKDWGKYRHCCRGISTWSTTIAGVVFSAASF